MSRELKGVDVGDEVGGGDFAVADAAAPTDADIVFVDAAKTRFELVDGEIAGRSNGRKIVFVVFCHVTQKAGRSSLAGPSSINSGTKNGAEKSANFLSLGFGRALTRSDGRLTRRHRRRVETLDSLRLNAVLYRRGMGSV